MRRLIPGVIQNTPNAGYYSFYPYLLWKWKQLGGAVDQDSFIPFYRRHEAALSVACALHTHRGGVGLNGVNGATAAGIRSQTLQHDEDELDLTRHAEDYMETPLGGYRLFYAVALQDTRLVIGGADGLVDRVTDHGAAVAAAFAETFEQTAYATDYFADRESVPAAVLRELGESVCLCTIPGRSDHELLLQTFFGEPASSPSWEERRRLRIESLSLLLEFHEQRSAQAADDLGAWRRALIDPRFSDGSSWQTTHSERRQSWRAYQLREIAVLAMTTIWSLYLAELGDRARATQPELRAELVSWLSAERLQFDPALPLRQAMSDAGQQLAEPVSLAREAELLPSEWRDDPKRAFCRAVPLLIVIPREVDRSAPGFDELLDEGGSYRWSLRHLHGWLDAHAAEPMTTVAGELLDAFHHQHIRVALTKLRAPTAQSLGSGDRFRDPFNFTEDEGVLRPLRPDEPSWSGARYSVANHLLWSLGLLSAPAPPITLTPLGLDTLRRYAGNA